ncbi:MAG: monoheme cytochrome C [Crocinitomicaceae bacterium]|nr:monoheme cytochrome C [Crocinitomicaceae bacterium]
MDKIRKKINWLIRLYVFALLLPFGVYIYSTLPEREPKIELVEIEEEPVIIDGIDVESGLIADTGYELVKTTCAACHSLELVTQNRATREGWEDIIRWMQETQKLWDLGESEVAILDYLGKNYAPKKAGRRKNLENIEWYEL